MGGSLLTACLLTALTAYVLFVTIATTDSNKSTDMHMPMHSADHPAIDSSAFNDSNRSLNMLQVALHRLKSLRRSPSDDGQQHIRPSEHIHSPPPDLAFLTHQQPNSRSRSPSGVVNDHHYPSSSSSSSSSSSTRWQQQQQQGRVVANRNMDMNRTNSQQWLSCKKRYGTRSFLSPDQRRKPPMLYTFPGE